MVPPELELDLDLELDSDPGFWLPAPGVHSQSSRSAPAHFRDLMRAQGLRPTLEEC